MNTGVQHAIAWIMVIGLIVIVVLTILEGMAKLSRRQAKRREQEINDRHL